MANYSGFSNFMSGVSGVYGMADAIFGFNRKRQIRDSKEMMKYSAILGEQQAERDYRRSMSAWTANAKWNEKMFGMSQDANKEFLQMQQDYNSPVAQAQRLKDAGLSVGLMMGGGGGTSGTASVGTPSGGAAAPPASSRPAPISPAEKLYGALQLEGMRTAIEGEKLENDRKRVQIEKEVSEANIKKTKEETNLLEIEGLHLGSLMLSKIGINQETANLNKLKNEEVRANVAKLTAETILPEIQKDLADFKMGREFKLTTEMTRAIIEKIEAEAKRQNWEMGEFTNWKNITQMGVEIGKAIIGAASLVGKKGM